MTRKHAIVAAAPSLIVSHGADFFGQDRHPLKAIKDLGPYIENAVSHLDRPTVAPFVKMLENPSDRTFPAADAAQLSELLLKVARTRRIKPAVVALARALADAAARAAADGDTWTWTTATDTGEER